MFFDGNCAEAMRFYERALGGKIEMMMSQGESPEADKMPPADRDRILHARLTLDGGGVLLASDATPPDSYEGVKGCSLSLSYPVVADAQKVFDALAEGGKVILPVQKTFWSEAFGMLVDRFGLHWMISGGQPAS
jgi:PhnB protein